MEDGRVDLKPGNPQTSAEELRVALAYWMPTRASILARIAEVEAERQHLDPLQFEEAFEFAVPHVLRTHGYSVREGDPDVGTATDNLDVFAYRAGDGSGLPETLGFQFLRFDRDAEKRDVDGLIHSASAAGCGKARLICPRGVSGAASRAAGKSDLVDVEMWDLRDLRDWVVAPPPPARKSARDECVAIVNRLSRQFAAEVARCPAYLDGLEWFQVEELLTPVLAAYGFDVTHTPYSQDGGKDHVLRFRLSRGGQKYYVEVKHWRKRVVNKVMQDFVRVVMSDGAAGGVLVGTSGHAGNVWESVADIQRRQIRLADRDTIVAWCRYWVKAQNGLVAVSADPLGELLFPTFEQPRGLTRNRASRHGNPLRN